MPLFRCHVTTAADAAATGHGLMLPDAAADMPAMPAMT